MEQNRERIVGISIPDDDLPNWMRELSDSGLSQDEINRFFARLNKTYRNELYGKEKEYIRRDLEKTYKEEGIEMAEENLENLVDAIIKERLDKGLELKK